MPQTAFEQLRDVLLSHSVGLQRLSATESRKILELLKRSEVEIRARIATRIATIGPVEEGALGFFTERRLDELLRQVVLSQRIIMEQIVETLAADLQALGAHEAEFLNNALRRAIPSAVGVSEFVATPELLRSIVNSKPFSSHLLGTHFRRLAQINSQATRRMRMAIEEGLVAGDPIATIMRRVDRVALRLTRKNARTLVNTAVAHVTSNMRERLYKANSDVIKGFQWVATLDLQTCELCASRDGFLYNLDFEPIDGGPPWDGGPGSIHPNDRCVASPVLRRAPAGSSQRVRASLDGQVTGSENYREWIAKQSKGRMEQVFGKTRAQLVADKKISVKKLFDFDDGELFRLDELREMDASLFD